VGIRRQASCQSRIRALRSELDELKSKTGTIRQQLQHFKAGQSALLQIDNGSPRGGPRAG